METEKGSQEEPKVSSKDPTEKRIFLVGFITFLITLLVVGGGVYAWQNQKIRQVREDKDAKIEILQDKITILEEEVQSLEESLSGSEKKDDDGEVDEITVLLKEIRNNSELGFAEVKEAEFSWREKNREPIIIKGKAIVAEDVEYFVEQKKDSALYSLLKKRGFESSEANVADGVQGSVRGFKKNNTVCRVDYWEPHYNKPQTEPPYVEVACGEL